MVSSLKYGKELMSSTRSLKAAQAAALTRRGRGFCKSMPVSSALRTAILAVLVFLLIPASTTPRVAEAAIASVAAVGTATNKTASTTLAVTVGAAGVTAGNSLIVAVAMNPSTATVTVADTQGNTYNLDTDVANGSGVSGVRTLVFSAHNITALVNTNTITVTFSAAVVTKAMSAASFSGLALISARDVTTSASGTSTAPSAGPTATTEIANELVVGAIGTEGPSGDTFTAGSGYSTTNFTRAGTTGGVADGNITIAPEYKIVSATGAQTADATITSRLWSAAVVTYRIKPAVWQAYSGNCTTVATGNFGGAGDIVCNRSSGADAFTASLGSVYKVRLFDGSGVAVGCADQSGLSATDLTSTTLIKYILNTVLCTGAASGTWHAVVFQNVSLPATYPNTNALQRTNQVAAEDSFGVDSGAIPEFPSPLAALGAGITAAALYLLMKRRLTDAPV